LNKTEQDCQWEGELNLFFKPMLLVLLYSPTNSRTKDAQASSFQRKAHFYVNEKKTCWKIREEMAKNNLSIEVQPQYTAVGPMFFTELSPIYAMATALPPARINNTNRHSVVFAWWKLSPARDQQPTSPALIVDDPQASRVTDAFAGAATFP
jgi:hypothetical protein